VPGTLKVKDVEAIVGLPKVTEPGPLIFVQRSVGVPLLSVTIPVSVVEPGGKGIVTLVGNATAGA